MKAKNKAPNRASIAIARANNARVAPRKARLVVDQIRGMKVNNALAILEHTIRRSNPIMLDLLKSAVANAMEKDQSVNPDELVVTEARVDQARSLKRMRARAMGRGCLIVKKSSHIILAVG